MPGNVFINLEKMAEANQRTYVTTCSICRIDLTEIEQADGQSRFREDRWDREGGVAVLVFLKMERFGKRNQLFRRPGASLPPSATASRPQLAGAPFRAMGVSLVFHPRNPHVPTTHMNVRFFYAQPKDADPIWWFGGGFDLTPYYGYREDAIHWHQTARTACNPFGESLYPRFKEACDQYFHLPHRNEARGVGGIFFDDYDEGGFEQAFAFLQSVGDHFIPAYLPIVSRRQDLPSTEAERRFQLYRRGRYVEFNLVYDRGTSSGFSPKDARNRFSCLCRH